MRRCDIIVTTRVSNPGNRGSVDWDSLPRETVATCEKHGMQVHGPVGSGDLCPIGKIEEATEVALKAIREAKSQNG